MEPDTNHDAYRKGQRNWAGLLLAIFLFFWISGITLAVHWIGWLVDQYTQNIGEGWSQSVWFFISLGSGFALSLPFIFVPLAWKNLRYRGVFQSWLLGVGYVFLLAPIRLVEPTHVQLANLLQIVLTAVFIVLFVGFGLWRGKIQWKRPSFNIAVRAMLPALLLAVVPAYPWLLWGSLGSLLDTFLNLAAGLFFGLAVGLVIVYVLMPGIGATSRGKFWDVTLAGLSIGAMLLVMAAALGFNGLQLLLFFALPGMGGAAAVFVYSGNRVGPGHLSAVSLFVGLTAAVPAMFIDPDEFALVLGLGQRDLLGFALLAGLVVMVISWGLSLTAVIWRGRVTGRLPRPFVAIGLSIFGVGALALYFLVGQPGFHGEQIFVIMVDQADVSSAETMSDYDVRRQFVYDTLVAEANGSQADIRTTLDKLGVDYTPYYLVNGMAVDGGPIIRFWLNNRPEVDRILDNPVLRPLPAQASPLTGTALPPTGPLWNQTLIGADKVWEEFGVTGEGIVIGQSDSGVQGDHLELAESYRGRESGDDYNWLDPWNGSASPTDIGGHGTHTLGSIVGQNTGIAPGAKWMGCVNLARNLANPAFYLDCMQFMLAPYPLGGDPFTDGDPLLSANVLNNSWGCPPLEGCDPNTFLAAVRALRAAGIFVVVSAGNDGFAGCESLDTPPAIYDEVFSVGAIDQTGRLADFSSLGPVTIDGSGRIKPDIVAPGVSVLSAFPNSSYEVLDGTSMAGPHVVGVVALIWSANPALIGQISQTEAIMTETAQSYTGILPTCVDQSQIPNDGVGFGMVDAYSAVKMALGE
ncbi:MAG: S8 family serine peptidase [Candidatus Promineifilaceae bacterium]